eukprot:TRINITY_DN75302_c0_g1_i1.p1 TRINITY_DN75302_c0_g1~~TRINITY_DN75302_c0_g1_i1.p1  ORF type:complete len:362 (-),score=65.67 TRINITY_DN75302_c0_g1_i1:51-1136(-)
MLVQASRDGDLEVVLRLLYTNPFVERQELSDSLWESVRCRRLDVLRSLLEFRVDPTSEPSPALSVPPDPLRRRMKETGVRWTPMAALAVNGSKERAQFVCELLCHNGGASSPATASSSLPTAATAASVAHTVAQPSARSVTPPPVRTPPHPITSPGAAAARAAAAAAAAGAAAAAAANARASSAPRTKVCRDSAVKCGPPALVAGASGGSPTAAATASPSTPRNAGATVGPTAATAWPGELQALRGLVEGGDCHPTLSRLSDEDLVAVETAAESLLRKVREHQHRRLEAKLQSVTRRHAAECRGRQSLEDLQACIVCSELPKEVLFLPCRHLCACERCAPQLAICPICRGSIGERVHCIRP